MPFGTGPSIWNDFQSSTNVETYNTELTVKSTLDQTDCVLFSDK